ncbi:MAG: crosslink repair DNA glycosylase YcaQ family protein [Dehalococcoidia bacterium]
MPSITLTRAQARHLLLAYHFTDAPTPAAVFDRLGSVQYDPLKPAGRNADLVFQARVPGYRVDDWEHTAYRDRHVYDAWDKQACLVPVTDWPFRRIYHDWYRERWTPRVLGPFPGPVAATLRELRERGPLSSLDFEDQQHVSGWEGFWYGPKLVKQVLRALWDSGEVVTTRRDSGRHVYDLAERVIPADLHRERHSDDHALEALVLRRHQTAGLLRPTADPAMWHLPLGRMPDNGNLWPAASPVRHDVIRRLVEQGRLVEVMVDRRRYHAVPSTLDWLDAPLPGEMRFVAPLDAFMWDRTAIEELFGFEYRWEVYVPAEKRRWGYYVLPVVHGDRIVARIDSRLDGHVWSVASWLWEPDAVRGPATMAALTACVAQFKDYLGAKKLKLPRKMDPDTRGAFRAGFTPPAPRAVRT